MKFVIAVAALGVLAARAGPVVETRAPPPGDVDILNLALTLEHLENAFYQLQLRRFSQRDFRNAGLPEGARQQLIEVGMHEMEHVAFLKNLLGGMAVRPCTYRFPVNNPTEFAHLSQVFENVGVGAYTGATASLSKRYVTDSASILGTEARQAAVIASYINGVEGWGGSWNSPLTMSQAYTLASGFIVSCPRDNPPLPVRVFPKLTFPPNAKPGDTVVLTFNNPFGPRVKLWVAFLSGATRTPILVAIINRRVTIPRILKGQVYAIVSTSQFTVRDRDTVAGPALLQFNYNLMGQPIPPMP
ncbi:putative ferritin-like domain containing protein [Lyophyllum shimeji]|uniref:Ferritin-like domain containing protein n=1 Tax=Lyophyllum shimeji TaxID=47721 RepID=A0A9P3Q1A4_LYOSH|nr:putative ferritin-like domain containing protein [Lyophyllum shimeji]